MRHGEPLAFDAANFDRLFPFHLALDRSLMVTSAGPVLARVLPSLEPPTPLGRHFVIRRPPGIHQDYESLGRERNKIFMLASQLRPELVLKGQIIPLADVDRLLFLGTPWITSLDQLPRLGLTISDFAVHDSIADFLVLVQTQQAAINDASRLAEKLRGARDNALEASRFKSEFLARVSHELRTPLNAILGFSEMLGKALFGPLPERYQRYAEHIHIAGRRLLDLINDLLDLSRIEAGRFELNRMPLSIQFAFEACRRIVEGEAQRKSIGLSLECKPPELTVNADARAFEQVLINLLSNAIKFTDAGGQVDVSAKTDMDATIVTVSDNGIGIDPHLKKHLFEPFRQAHSALTRRHGGSGLGLSICQKLVELHGGSISIDSAPGRGTVVTIRLPNDRAGQGL